MIIKGPTARGAVLAIMRVTARRVIDGAPFLDLIDRGGRLYTDAEILSLGGAPQELAAVPPEGADVLTLTTPQNAPLVLGTFSTSTDRALTAELSGAGEYPPDALALDHVALRSGEARLIAAEGSLYAAPVLRVQGRLEVSDGASPTQSGAVAEPTLDTLAQYQAAINTLAASLEALRLACAAAQAPSNLPAFATAAAAIPPLSPTLAPAPNDTIASDLLKIER